MKKENIQHDKMVTLRLNSVHGKNRFSLWKQMHIIRIYFFGFL